MNGFVFDSDVTVASGGSATQGKCLSMTRKVDSSFSAESRLNCGLRPKLDTETDGPEDGGDEMDEWGPLPELPSRPNITSMESRSDSGGRNSSTYLSCREARLSRSSGSSTWGISKSMLNVFEGPGGGGGLGASWFLVHVSMVGEAVSSSEVDKSPNSGQ